MSSGVALFRRECKVEAPDGAVSPLVVTFYAPWENPDADDYRARAHIACAFFEKEVVGLGEDAPQAFFWLPVMVVSFLSDQRRAGFEAYWFEKGDLDFNDFWTYRPFVGCAAGA